MGDEHLNTILETESDKVIKSSVKNLVLIPSESKIDFILEEFVGELAPIPPGIHEADFDPEEYICLDDQLFYDDTSSDDDSFEDFDYVEASPPNSELVSLEEVKDFDTKDGEIVMQGIFKNFDNMCDVPSCDKKQFDAESDLMESLLNRDTLIFYSPKIDSLLEEFAGELAPINPIPPGIHEADFDPKEDIHLDDQMFYDYTSSDDDSFEDINYVEASPPDSKLVNIEEVEDDILCAKLSNIYLFIAKFESNHTEETRSGSTTIHAKNSLPKYDSFHFEIESDQGELSRAVMETIDKIDAFLNIDVSTGLKDGYHDSEGDIIYLENLLINNTIPNLSPEDTAIGIRYQQMDKNKDKKGQIRARE
ncbi:hypothetical protein Tco_0897115 [Tanacetum coccineum]